MDHWDTWTSAISSWSGWGTVGESFAWIVTGCILLVAAVGCVIPILPGHLIILIAAIAHHLMLGADSGVEWWTYAILVVCLIISQVLEFMSGAAGSKWFGGTRWGSIGALTGGVVGMFFFPLGLLLGPLIGAFSFEWLFAKRTVRDSTKSGVGSVFGTLTGLVVKAMIGAVMITWFLVDAIWLNSGN